MAKSRKRKKGNYKVAQKFNENSFLKNQLRKLPIDNCYIISNWKESGQTTIIITRKHINDNYSAAIFYVDLLCAGVKETFFVTNKHKDEIEDFLEDDDVTCSYALVHNIIWGAVEFADEIGIKPHKDFIKTQYFLEEDTEEIEFMDIEFGKLGSPIVVIDNENKNYDVIKILDKTIGKENYKILNIDEEFGFLDELPLEYEELGFDSKKEMMDELLSNNSEKEIDEYFEVFFEMFEEEKNIDIKNIPENYEPITIVRIIETIYFIAISPKKVDEQGFQELFAQLFFDDIPDSPFDIPDEKITYEPIDLGINKTEEEEEAHLQLLNKMNSKRRRLDKSILKQISLFPDNPVFKAMYYKWLYEKGKMVKIKKSIDDDYKKHPDYLFMKLYYGEFLIDEKRFDKIYEIFENKTRLDELYPERVLFHITEYVGFCQFHIDFNIAIGKIETAVQYYDSLTKYHVDGNEELMAYIANKVLKAKSEFLSSVNLK
ncbi:MAG: hypothetical protein DRI95_00215 [Bacteroidetes bacterium]|nr:MAG: hypothetical protein DRI95_00215 [Bacteroidota bacterium]